MGKRSDYERKPRDFYGEKNPSYKHGANAGGKRTTEYQIWAGIKSRINNPSGKIYPYYGGRGITYDPRWEDFKNFLEDVGERPSKQHSLDRINNELGYFKENVRWATRKQQSCNRRNNIVLEGMILKDWCRDKNFNYKTVWRWLVLENKTVEHVLNRGRELWEKEAST